MCEALQKSSDEAWFVELITGELKIYLQKAGEVKYEVNESIFVSDSERELYEDLQSLTSLAAKSVAEKTGKKWRLYYLSLLLLSPSSLMMF